MTFALLFAAAVLAAKPASATLFTIPVNNDSDQTLAFGISPIGLVFGSTGISGSLNVDATIENDVVTSIQFLGGSVQIADATVQGDFLAFGIYPGTMSGVFTSVQFAPIGGPIAVTDGFFPLDGMPYIFDQGTLDFSLFTAVSGLVTGTRDFSSSSQSLFSFPDGPQGSVQWDGEKLSLSLPVQAGTLPENIGGIDVFFLVSATINGEATAAVVPESSSLILAGIGLLSAGAVGWMRRRTCKA